MSRRIVGPFNRVEGDLEVSLDIVEGRVRTAQVNAPMYRGFEQILLGKPAHDALVYVPRICGICSVSQSVAAARALADLMGVTPPPNGLHAINLMQATENLADHLTHFYLFFMPDFTRASYAGRPWHDRAHQRFQPDRGTGVRLAIAARQRWFTLLGILAGKWPHTQSIEPGGSSRPVEAAERLRLLARVQEFRAFLEQELFAAPLEQIAGLTSESALLQWAGQAGGGDFRLFLEIAHDLDLARLGSGPGLYLCYGAYPRLGEGRTLPAGIWQADPGCLRDLDVQAVSEDATHAWLDDTGGPRHPARGRTRPVSDKSGAYTWNKAPRLDGQVAETGAIARQLVDGHMLMRDAVGQSGGNVYTRVLARLLELARIVPWMEEWLRALDPGQPWCRVARLPAQGQGVGLSEAARGSLGHWVELRDGRIANYQIIAPTSWNFSPRDQAGVPGPLEQALEGVQVGDEATPVAVQHIVRSFDPCMVCTVH